MKNKIEHILIGLLWLLAVTLGASFWFNMRFGFNLFSASHWGYLSYLQAAQMPVRASFYVSLALTLFIMILGMYVLLHPRFRKIKFPRRDISGTATKNRPVPATTNVAAPVVVTPPAEPQSAPAATSAPLASPAPQRPPRLNMPTMTNFAATPTVPTSGSPLPGGDFVTSAPANTAQDSPEIREIFTSAGYTIKKNPKIGDLTPNLFAIGTNETLWIGAIGVETSRLRNAMDKLGQIFSDTLDDIYINMNGFIIGAPDAATSEFEDILMFDSVAALRDYMAAHPNPPLPADDEGNFDAYSAYIGTVIDYIGKI